jgi:hypothetical protein
MWRRVTESESEIWQGIIQSRDAKRHNNDDTITFIILKRNELFWTSPV